jgi:precorrin-6Y C5,15-methyltransferase (decarboxylating)
MLTIVGNGMGAYDFKNVPLDVAAYDVVVCDKNFKEEGTNIKKLSFREAKEYILEHYESKNILYVVTGSPFFFSAGMLLAKKIPSQFVKVIDNTSSLRYMQSKLFFADAEIEALSLHGRSTLDLSKFLTQKYTFILCDKDSIEKVKELTHYLDPHDIKVTIGYKFGYADEVIKQINIFDYSYRAFDLMQPYVLLIERLFTPKSVMSGDDEFATERGMITKRYKRHLSLQNLELEPNQLLWDVGAGSGSCSIEAYKRYKVRTILFEKQPQRCEYIEQNLKAHHVCDTKLYCGDASEWYKKEPSTPERIFIGGGGEVVIAELAYLYERLAEGGIMVANFVTLTNLTQAITVLQEAGIAFDIKSISLTTYKMKLLMPEPERVMHQIIIKKERV